MIPRALLLGGALVVFSLIALAPTVFAMGSKPKPPTYTRPNPLRYIVVRPIQNLSEFQTPNQVKTTIDQIQAAFSAILDGVTTNSGFSVIQAGDVSALDQCGRHLELWPTVVDFILDDTTLNVQFGFNSGGLINVGQPQVTASDTLRLGSVKMVFIVYECDNAPTGSCASLAASSADQTILGNGFSFNVNWAQFSVPGSILTQTNLSGAVRSIMASGIGKLTSSPQMATVPWSTTILSVNADGSFTMFAGENANVGLNQYFTIYQSLNASSQCGVYQALACAFTSEVDNASSVIQVYQTLSQGQGVAVAAGDVVEIGSRSCSTGLSASDYGDSVRSP